MRRLAPGPVGITGSVQRRLSIGAVATAFLVSACMDFTDGATRLANQIETEVAAFERSSASTTTITHQPIRVGGSAGNGCGEAYRLQIDKNGALIIWCKGSVTGATTGSHMTSYHARFIDSSQTWIVEKKKGETVAIDLQKRAGAKPLVTAVR